MEGNLSTQQEQAREYLHLPKNVLEHIFTGLSPRDLALASGVATSWRATAALAPWDTFYAERWPITPLDTYRAAYTSWHSLFSSRMALARSFKGRPQLDRLSGHTSGVKVAKILSESDLLLTGSVDRRLALWDLETGTRLASSLQHAGTVRSIAIDDDLLVTGSSDHRIRVWRPWKESSTEQQQQQELQNPAGSSSSTAYNPQTSTTTTTTSLERRRQEFRFQIDGARTVLAGGHSGPVTALELAPTALFSGSWDYCVRVWDRNCSISDGEELGGGGAVLGNILINTPAANNATNTSLRCIQVLHFDDMVTDMSFKRTKLFVAAGREAHLVDAAVGGGLRQVASFHRHASNSIVTAVEASEDERFLFYSTAEGGVYACDVRCDPRHHSHHHTSTSTDSTTSNRSIFTDPGFSCSSAVTGLSWDFPWLAASLQNGEILLLNAEATLLGGYSRNTTSTTTSSFIATGSGASGSGGRVQRVNQQQQQQQHSSSRWPSRALTAGVPGGGQCVNISGKWLVGGYESGCIVSWDFSRAEEAERAAEALRSGRRKKREQRRQNAKNKKQQQKRQSGDDDDHSSGQRRDIPRSAAVPIPPNHNTTAGTASLDAANDDEEESVDFEDLHCMNTTSISRSLPDRFNYNSTGNTSRTTAPSLRFPAPISLSRSPGSGGGGGGSGSEGQQQQRGRDSWHVLRMTRSNSNPNV